jgi:hypothetical protein
MQVIRFWGATARRLEQLVAEKRQARNRTRPAAAPPATVGSRMGAAVLSRVGDPTRIECVVRYAYLCASSPVP